MLNHFLCLLAALDWGSVPDWVMIGVTGYSLRLILGQLKAQVRATEIESSRYRLERMPVFGAKIEGNVTCSPVQEGWRIGARLRIELKTNNEARNIKLLIPEDAGKWERLDHYRNKIFTSFNYQTGFGISLGGTFHPLKDSGRIPEFANFNFAIQFEDDNKNAYEQKATFFYFNNQKILSISYPKRLNNELA